MKNDATVVLKLDLHSNEYARKVENSVRHFEGVEDVNADYNTGKLTVKGNNVDPYRLWEMVEGATKKKVELLSYECKLDGGSGSGKDKKPKKAQFNTEVVGVHCGGSLFGYLKDKLKKKEKKVVVHSHGHTCGLIDSSSSDSSSEE